MKIKLRNVSWLISLGCLCYFTYNPAAITAPTIVAPTVSMSEIKSCYTKKQYSQVLVLTTQYIQRYPKDPDAFLFQGYAYYQLNDDAQAERTFKQVLSMDPHYPDAWIALADLYSSNMQYQNALDTINEGLISLPRNIGLLSKKAIIVVKMALKSGPALGTHIPMQTAENTTATEPKIENLNLSGNRYKKVNITYDSIKALKAANKLEQAKQDAINYLALYPNDPDVRNLLGIIYEKQQAWDLAAQQFSWVLAEYPTYPGTRLELIHVLMQQENYPKVINIALTGLQYPDDHDDLNYAIANAFYAQKNYPDALQQLKTISNYQQNPQADALYKAINTDTNYRYESYVKVGTNTTIIPVRNPNQVWSLSSVYAEYDTPEGIIGVQLNYQTRPGDLRAQQYVFYAQPWLTKTNYLALTYATAHQPNLFPNQLVYGEDYQLLPYNFGISAGDTYRKMPLNYFNSYTGSLFKYMGDYYIALRPTYYVPNQGPRSLLWTGNIQKYFTAVDYLGLSLSDGTSPDLADLNTVNFLKTHVKIYSLSGQYGFTPQLAMQYGIGQELQNFGHDNLRHYTFITLGLSFRDV